MARKKSIHYVNNAEFSQAVVDYVTIADEAKKEEFIFKTYEIDL